MFEILGLDFIRKASSNFLLCIHDVWRQPCSMFSPLQADGHVIFLEANRDPSWVIDGGAKQEPWFRKDFIRYKLYKQLCLPAPVIYN